MNSLSMNQQEYLEKAQEYESIRKQVALDPWRLQYHIMPESGWLNDPNGLCQFHGTYHVYYQYSPFDVEGKVKLWGHVTSKDLLHWKQEEPVLFPDSRDDLRGVYSGSAFLHDDELYFYYTGNVKLMDQAYDYVNAGREQNTILVTSKDGFHMGEKQCVLRNEDYPDTMSCHVRDPKLYEQDGKTYMVLGARTKDSQGCVLAYETTDLHTFTYATTILPETPFGYMWECPDLFDLDGQRILITCPQGVPLVKDRYQNVYQCGYFKIDGMFPACYHLSEFVMLDYGFDFYAPQSFVDEKGRRILLGWMGMPDIPYENPTIKCGWQHALTLPRVLSYYDGKLHQTPVEELHELRRDRIICEINDLVSHQISERVYECNVEFHETADFTLRLRKETVLAYDATNKRLTLSMGEEGYGRDVRTCILEELHNLTIYSDTSSLELFVNDGTVVFTSRVYEMQAETILSFEDCQIQGNVVWYKLELHP